MMGAKGRWPSEALRRHSEALKRQSAALKRAIKSQFRGTQEAF